MKRLLEKKLVDWKESKNRKPLILQGVRQCGKTFTLRQFGSEHYKNTAYFNFERDESLKAIFEDDLDPHRIIRDLSERFDVRIDTDTLVIFDEIQFCGRALTSLKYFCENAPQYHIVCAGSLLGVMLSQPLSFPVGKVEFLTLRSMNFYEFLLANGEDALCKRLLEMDSESAIPAMYAGLLKRYLSEFMFTGGMPEVVKKWISERNTDDVRHIQMNILHSYDSDFAKHAPKKDIPKLNAIWRSIPEQLARENNKFFFGHAVEGGRAREMADALQWLADASLVYIVKTISRPSIPLSAYATSSFKLYYADVGLMGAMADVPPSSLLHDDDRYKEFKGAMAENYVLTELMSISDREVFCWRSGSQAEVDFVRLIKDEIIPIEVKSERSKRLRSLEEYISKFDPDVSMVISKMNIKTGKVTFLPLCMVWKIESYVR